MCEEVFDTIDIPKEIFLESQQTYMNDPTTKNELEKAIKTGQPSRETLSEKPDLAKSMRLRISAIQAEQPLQRGDTLRALRESKDGYGRQRSQVNK